MGHSPLRIGGGTKEAALLACACHDALHTAHLLQGPGCHCVWGVVCSDSIPSGVYQPEQHPVILEVCEGGLCGPSVHALEADILPSTTGGKPYTLLPISSDPDVDRGPLHLFAATTLPIASREGHGGEMPMCVKCRPASDPRNELGRSCSGSLPCSGARCGRTPISLSTTPVE